MNEYLVDIYEEVLSYRRDLESILHDVPDFPNKFECEDAIKQGISELDSWLKERENDYRKLIAKEEAALEAEYWRDRI